ncbi:MAG: DNA alkylation repair protein [Bacteroidetes bacterium]|nr:DNA alkylation repair protein [Bacteroidota bacterium]
MSLKTFSQFKAELRELGSLPKSKNSARFFKTGKGQYGEGDIFLGVTMPEQRKVVKQYCHLTLNEIEQLLQSPEHEFRMCALLILVTQYKEGTKAVREKIYMLYLNNTKWINNWDLVDASAEYIVGPWLEEQKEQMKVLKNLAKSESLWKRRIAMLATFSYIKKGNSKEALQIAHLLLNDDQDLIHKAVGWMLREIGKRCSVDEEEIFLKKHYLKMPRTMLRYAIEHFPERKRKAYLSGKI